MPAVDGTTITFPVAHFTKAGGATPTVADFVALVRPYVSSPLPQTVEATDTLLDIVAAWTSLFGDEFCATQPICGQALQIVRDSLAMRAGEACLQAQTFLAQQEPALAREAMRLVIATPAFWACPSSRAWRSRSST